MLWLYRSLLSHLLHNHSRVLEQQRTLDRISIERFTSSTGRPSTDLAAVYQCVVTEPGVEPLGLHTRAGDGATDTYLSFGNLFWKDAGDEVYAVLTAACDLAYSPGRERRFPGDRFGSSSRVGSKRLTNPRRGLPSVPTSLCVEASLIASCGPTGTRFGKSTASQVNG